MPSASFAQTSPGPAFSLMRAMGTLLRSVAALGLAGAATFFLFALMQALIAMDDIPIAQAAEPVEVTINFKPEERETVRPPRGFNVEPVDPPPARPTVTVESQPRPSEGGYTIAAPPIDNDVIMAGTGEIAMPPPPLSLRVEPAYPRTEQTRGIQGDCTIRYDILASGRAVNARVLACDSRGFERASLEAVSQWRHAEDRTAAPETIVRRGVTTTLAFRLAE